MLGVVHPKRRCPFQNPAVALSHFPGGELFHAVMPLAEMSEVSDVGWAAERKVLCVVNFGSNRGDSASGKPAMLVSRAKVPVDGCRALVSIGV